MKKVALIPPAFFLAMYVVALVGIFISAAVPNWFGFSTLLAFMLPYAWWLAVYSALKKAYPTLGASAVESLGIHLPIAISLISAVLWLSFPDTNWGRESGKFLLISMLIALWIGASSIVRAERLAPEGLIGATAFTALQMFFLPAGIWWLHPRVRRLLGG